MNRRTLSASLDPHTGDPEQAKSSDRVLVTSGVELPVRAPVTSSVLDRCRNTAPVERSSVAAVKRGSRGHLRNGDGPRRRDWK
jgi:hypothetical protein